MAPVTVQLPVPVPPPAAVPLRVVAEWDRAAPVAVEAQAQARWAQAPRVVLARPVLVLWDRVLPVLAPLAQARPIARGWVRAARVQGAGDRARALTRVPPMVQIAPIPPPAGAGTAAPVPPNAVEPITIAAAAPARAAAPLQAIANQFNLFPGCRESRTARAAFFIEDFTRSVFLNSKKSIFRLSDAG